MRFPFFFCIEIENTINKFFYFSKKLADIEYVLEFINRVLRYINILIFYINVITLSNVTNRMKYKGFNINTLKYTYYLKYMIRFILIYILIILKFDLNILHFYKNINFNEYFIFFCQII